MFSTGNKYLNTNRADAWKFNVLNLCFSFHFVSIHMDFFPLVIEISAHENLCQEQTLGYETFV